MTIKAAITLATLAAVLFPGPTHAQSGPVATSCADDIAKLCPGKPHDGSVRICLEQRYDKVSATCKSAL